MEPIAVRRAPGSEGTTEVVFEPLDFMAPVLTPRDKLTRSRGVLAPNHRWCEQVTPARRGRPTEPATYAITPFAQARHSHCRT